MTATPRDDILWILRGTQRQTVFLALPDEFFANKLSKDIGDISLREISRHVRHFEERGLVRCLNPNDPYRRLYRLETKGKKLQRDTKQRILGMRIK